MSLIRVPATADPPFVTRTGKHLPGGANSGAVRTVNIPIDPLKINNGQTSYALTTCLSPNDIFCAARITYTYDSAGE